MTEKHRGRLAGPDSSSASVRRGVHPTQGVHHEQRKRRSTSSTDSSGPAFPPQRTLPLTALFKTSFSSDPRSPCEIRRCSSDMTDLDVRPQHTQTRKTKSGDEQQPSQDAQQMVFFLLEKGFFSTEFWPTPPRPTTQEKHEVQNEHFSWWQLTRPF